MSYYQKLIPGFFNQAAAWNKLLRAGQSFKWMPEVHAAFWWSEACADRWWGNGVHIPHLGSPQMLRTLALGLFCLRCSGLRSEKAQKEEERPIVDFFTSKSLGDKNQRRYCITERQPLAVVVSIQQFRHCLPGRQFTVRTDYSAFTWVLSFKVRRGQMIR